MVALEPDTRSLASFRPRSSAFPESEPSRWKIDIVGRKEPAMEYYVNTQPQYNGDHEVHKSTCMHLPDVGHRLYLGNFASDWDALLEARKRYLKADGCFYCCPSIHLH